VTETRMTSECGEPSLEPDFPSGDVEDYVWLLEEGLDECQKDISLNLHIRDKFRSNNTIVWIANELIKEGLCHLRWLRTLINRAGQ